MRKAATAVCGAVWLCVAWAPAVQAQQASATPEGLSGSASFGLSLTQGNTDTLNIAVTDDSVYDPKTRNVMKWSALYLRGKQNGLLSVNRVATMFRDEYTLNRRTFLFAQFDWFHDTFKGVDYLIAPTAGVGYKVIDNKITTFEVNGGVGGVVEKDTGFDALGSAAVTLGERFLYQVSETITLKEAATSLIKTNDVGDGLYGFTIGVSAKVNSRLQLSIDLLDTFKNRPVPGLTHKHDLSVITGVVAKY
jgi:putative salt-induced outer membrane protein YdiY